ncbi:MAG: copper amine oxidase N-terminal domain-containing protein [Lachnospiraceae bacterium]|nr:copper amine oxidase N-terminal domain-containing protein [Lachnospiraceae bacterium]
MKFNLRKSFAIAMAITSAMTLTAFAEETETASTAAQETNVEVTSQATTNEVTALEEEKYELFSGAIESIQKTEGDNYSVTILSGEETVVFTIQDQFILDQSDLTYKKAGDLLAGEKITAIWDKTSSVTTSLPPIAPGAIGFVLNAETGFIDLSEYNAELVNSENSLMLNISEGTVLASSKGTDAAVAKEDLAGKKLLVLYTTTTKSIPAQTTPELVMIIDVEESASETPEETTPELIPLRSTCEALGYTVKWVSNDEPVVISKDSVTISVILGSGTIKVGDEERTFEAPVILQDGSMYISNQIKSYI